MTTCPLDVTFVEVLEQHKLKLIFEDGVSGIVDIAKIIPFEGIFEPLKDKDYFAKVAVNKDIGTICWPNGADISPSVLYKSLD